jgi:hypothetical protein
MQKNEFYKKTLWLFSLPKATVGRTSCVATVGLALLCELCSHLV